MFAEPFDLELGERARSEVEANLRTESKNVKFSTEGVDKNKRQLH